ncbi:MAG: SpoIID/LytB domain-containing protein [Eubacterium sp.]|nr:SpoIID/LytB domain-containing protein [Eubacterium sp.]
MDRAEKLKKYGHKKGHKQGKRPFKQPANAGTGLLVAGVAGLLVLAGLFFFAFYHKKEEAVLSYVTNEELASCMSFLQGDAMPKEWEKRAESYVTQGQLKDLIQNIGLAGTISVAGGNGQLKRDAVMDCYEQILDYLDLAGVVRKETILVLSWDGTSCQTPDGILKGNLASFGFSSFHTYGVYLLDDTILGIKAESEKTVALRQAQAHTAKGGKVSFTYEKIEYKIPCIDKEGMEKLQKAAGSVSCTLCIKGGAITKIKNIKEEESSGEKQETTASKKLSDTVKVLLLNKGDLYYDQIYLSCDSKWVVKKSQKQTAKKPSEVQSIKALKLKKGKFAVIEPSEENGRLYFTDRDGSHTSNGYYGSFTVYRDAKGYYVVNKVKIEKYLYSVVASEMPASFGEEALKAQAVCARSYVYRQMAAGDYSSYHAQIDDSTNYQVYNKSEVVDADVQAVEATAGEAMYVKDEIVNAYYFSSSAGHTANMEIWNQDEDTYPYLKIKSLNPSAKDGQKLDLSDESDFKQYISNTDVDAFDSTSRYFRWKARAELSSCLKELKEKIKQRHEINPALITYYRTTGKKAQKVSSLKGFGGVEKMYCAKRGKSGAILVLTIQFEFGKVEIRSEYNIRSVIGIAMEQITYADGTTDTASRFLPSAYFTISLDKKSKRYVLTGGGNGHGMGMSQYGAAGMAQAGWNYKEILSFYYDGANIQKVR